MKRRRVLALAVGCSLGVTAGCLNVPSFSPEESELKPNSWNDHCPGSGPLDVEWPEKLERSTVRSFLEDYEHRYMRDVWHEFDPFLKDRYDTNIDVTGIHQVGDGYEASVSTRASPIYGTLRITASKADATETGEAIAVEDIPAEDIYWFGDSVSEALKSESQPVGEVSGPYNEEIAAQFAELSTEMEELEAITDHSILVDVDGRLIELNFEYKSSGLVGDMWRDVVYYIDDTGLVIEWDGGESVMQCRDG